MVAKLPGQKSSVGHEGSFAVGGLHDPCTAPAPLRLLAAIELSTDVRQRLLPMSIRFQVPRQLHGVVKHPTDHDQARFRAVDKKVARPPDDIHTWFDVVPAQAQVPRSNTCAEFGPCETAWSVGLACHVAERGDDQALVALSSGLAKLFMSPGEDGEDIALRSFRQPIAQHQPAVLAGCAARRPSCPTKSSS